MALTSLDGLIAALCGSTAQRRSIIYPVLPTGLAADRWFDLFPQRGLWGTGTVATGAGALCDRTVAASIPFTNPAGGHSAYLTQFVAAGPAGTLMLYDRLWHTSGLVCNVNTLQPISGAAMIRPDSSGFDVEPWIVNMSAAGPTGTPTVTLGYHNQANVAHTAVTTPPANFFQGATNGQFAAWPLALAAGDYGVQSVDSVQLGTALLSAGNFAIVLLRRIAALGIRAGVVSLDTLDGFQLGLSRIDNSACLAAMVYMIGTAGGELDGRLQIAEG